MVKYLNKRYPEVQLSALIFEKNREILDLLDLVEQENILTIRDNSIIHFCRDIIQVTQIARRRKLDVVIDCELFARVSSLLSFVSGAPIRVGFHSYNQKGLYRGDFINKPVLYNPYLHISKQFLNLAYALEGETVPNTKYLVNDDLLVVPKKDIPRSVIKAYSEKLQRDFPRLLERRLVLIYPSGGILPLRAWPLDNFCHLCRALIDEDLSVGIIGVPSAQFLGVQICDFTASEYCINLTGYTRTIEELLLLFRQAALLITNDGGPGQFAAVSETPSIIFFGPETPRLYAPLSSNAHSLYHQIACSPCLTAYNHRNSPCDGDNQCLKRITVDEVLVKARRVLETPQSNL
jgi:ADP-heptose:LPS heptosyltransferase